VRPCPVAADRSLVDHQRGGATSPLDSGVSRPSGRRPQTASRTEGSKVITRMNQLAPSKFDDRYPFGVHRQPVVGNRNCHPLDQRSVCQPKRVWPAQRYALWGQPEGFVAIIKATPTRWDRVNPLVRPSAPMLSHTLGLRQWRTSHRTPPLNPCRSQARHELGPDATCDMKPVYVGEGRGQPWTATQYGEAQDFRSTCRFRGSPFVLLRDHLVVTRRKR
jgi:hypothetical protein